MAIDGRPSGLTPTSWTAGMAGCSSRAVTRASVGTGARPGRDDADRLDRGGDDFVRHVHRALVDLHPNDPADRSGWLRDGYVHELERQIADLAARRPDFPADDSP